MSDIRTLPELKPQTLAAIEECMSKGAAVSSLSVNADVLFRARRVCAPFLYLAFEIREFSERLRRGDFLCIACTERRQGATDNSSIEDYCDCEGDDMPQAYGEACLKNETNLSRLGYISARALEACDVAFSAHLGHAIGFFKGRHNLRRFAVAQAVTYLAGGFTPQQITLKAVKKRVEDLLNGPASERSLTDDLEVLGVSFNRQPKGQPKKKSGNTR